MKRLGKREVIFNMFTLIDLLVIGKLVMCYKFKTFL